MMKVAVIGCTHAGTFATKQILAENPDAEVTVYEKKRRHFILILRNRALSRWPGKRSPGTLLFQSR